MKSLVTLIRWIVLGAVVGAACGVGSAGFLWLLALATDYRDAQPDLVFALPAAGFAVGLVYARFGKAIAPGTNLVIDTIHDGGPEIPLRMFPMVLAGTVITHLFGGSAGREGTAVQMGASLADWIAHRAKLDVETRRQLLAAGVAGGFGSVFGTPIAGTVFGLEFVVRGRLQYEALVPALVAAVVGDVTTRACGIVHTVYPSAPHVAFTPLLAGKWVVFAIAVAIVTLAFIELTHAIKRLGARYVPMLALRMAIGGAIVVGGWWLLQTSDYLGLGIPTIVRAFTDTSLPEWSFAAKLGFTAVTLGAGFLGGEVTPLFFIGAALGNLLAGLLGIPLALGAGVGMAGVFAASAKTPLALSIMAVELLGGEVLPHVAIVCVLAYVLTGARGIYGSQRAPR